jgi:L-ascorbate metabolism protein UlaG (beta-lactamase superfamily)
LLRELPQTACLLIFWGPKGAQLRTVGMIKLLTLLLAMLVPALSACTSAPAYQGEVSAHFDGKRFSNRDNSDKSAWELLKFGWGSLFNAASWPEEVEIQAGTVAQPRVYDGISVTFVNHSTFLIQADGLNILTDPIFSSRASPFQALGPKRVHRPGIAMADLPPIDLILISHNHYDHLDKASLQQLSARQQTPPLILAGLGNGRYFSSIGLDRHRDMDWLDSVEMGAIEIVFTECRHSSGRGLSDQKRTLWGSFVIKTSRGSIYFAGDTGYGPHFADAALSHGPFVLSLLPIGAYEPRDFMEAVHLNPADAVQAHLDLESEQSIGIHFGTFQLTYEAIDQPLIDLQLALQQAGVDPAKFGTLAPGESRLIAPH